jgi:type I restriction enzyme R subunit
MLTPDEQGHDLEEKFKNPDDPLCLVFVCSMWLTGFDAPTVSTLYMDKPMKDHTLMQTIARANRVTDHQIYGKTKTSGLVVDYYNIFRNLKKAFASYGGEDGGGNGGGEKPVKEFEQLYATLQESIDACLRFCHDNGVDLMQIHASTEVFSKLALFDEFADRLLRSDDVKREFVIYDNLIDSLYEACKPDILRYRQEFRLKDIIHYLRDVIDNKAERGNLDSAKRRITQLLNESIVADPNHSEPDHFTAGNEQSQEAAYAIKDVKAIDLSRLNIEKLREEFKTAPLKHIEINDLRAFISSKLEVLLEQNTTRSSFAEKLREIIDAYNAGGNSTENYFEDLVAFVEQLREEELRAAREGLSEDELELFDLLKKENLSKDESQRVKLASKSLLKRLRDEKPRVLIQDWYKDSQSRQIVQSEIKKILNMYLPETYDRTTYSEKCDKVFDHVLSRSVTGNLWVGV